MEAISQSATATHTTVQCTHCNLPVPAHRSHSRFCCAGCEGVYRFIQSAGFGQYYSLKRDVVGKAVDAVATSYKYMDDESFAQTYVSRDNSGLAHISFYLSGIHCAACIWLLEKLPQLLPDVRFSRVQFGQSTLQVCFDDSKLRISALASAIHALGYPPLPTTKATARDFQRRSTQSSLIRLGVAAVCAMNIMMLSVSLYEGEASGMEPFYQNLLSWGCLLLALPSITYCAWPFYEASWRGLRARSVHIDLPISGAIVIAYLCSVYNTVIGRFEIYYDSIAALVLLLLAGRFLQKRSMERAMDSSELLAALTPRSALKIVNGKIEEVFVNSIRPGDLVSVPHAGTIPCDGVLESERSSLDLSVLTGESTPVVQQKGAELFASTVNTGEALLMRVTKVGADTRIGGVMNLLQASSQKRPRVALFLDAIARFFVWAVLAAAAGTFAYWFGYRRDLVTAIDATVALLVVSCPCVVALATPLTFSLAVAQAAKVGILLKGQEVIERLRQVKIICLDKTRTLTKGQCAVTAHWVAHFVPSNFWNTLANIEQNQRHPVAHALSQFALAVANNSPHIQSAILPPEVHNHPGLGVEALIEGKNWRVGNARWVNLDPSQIDIRPELQVGMNQSAATKVFVRIENKLAAIFELADELRPEAPAIVRELHQRGYKLFILSGDSSAVVSDIARQLDIPQSQAHGELTPEQKAEKVASLARIAPTAMIGDGVNDALALQSAHVGIGVHGSAEVCLQAADVYALKPGLMPLRDSLQGAQNTFGVMYRNLFFSGTYNLFGSLLAIAGLLGPLGAAILMPLSSLTVVSSAIFSRTFSANPKEPRL